MSGISDEVVIKFAKQDDRITLTFDKDYGELIFRYGVLTPPAVIFFRYKGREPYFAGTFLIKLLSDVSISLDNNFTVVEEQNIRQRKY